MTVPPAPGQPSGSNPYPPSPGQWPYGQQPYGQFQQPPQQPFGQRPPQPGQPSMFPYGQAPMGPHVPPEPPKKNGLGWIRVAASIVVILVGLGITTWKITSSTQNAEVGDCLHVPNFSATALKDVETLDCSADEATSRIAVKLDDGSASCPEGDYDEIFYDELKFCLVLNVKEGECLANVTSQTEGYDRVPCTDPSAEMAILRIVEGSMAMNPDQACIGVEGVEGPIYYSEPPTVLCFGRPTAV